MFEALRKAGYKYLNLSLLISLTASLQLYYCPLNVATQTSDVSPMSQQTLLWMRLHPGLHVLPKVAGLMLITQQGAASSPAVVDRK